MTITFHLTVFENLVLLKKFFSHDVLLREPYSPSWRYSTAYQLAMAPIRLIYALVLTLLSNIAYFFGKVAAGRVWQLRATHQIDPLLNAYICFDLRKDVLVPTINHQRLDTTDIYLQEDMPVPDSLRNQIARQSFQFFLSDGVCNGSCFWFLMQYMKAVQISDPIQRACLVAQLFTDGAPREASLLQILFPNRSDHTIPIRYQSTNSIRLSPSDSVPLKDLLSHLNEGIYKLEITIPKEDVGHTGILIKINSELWLYFDPSYGLIRCEGEKGFQNLLFMLDCHRAPNADLQLVFHQIQM